MKLNDNRSRELSKSSKVVLWSGWWAGFSIFVLRTLSDDVRISIFVSIRIVFRWKSWALNV